MKTKLLSIAVCFACILYSILLEYGNKSYGESWIEASTTWALFNNTFKLTTIFTIFLIVILLFLTRGELHITIIFILYLFDSIPLLFELNHIYWNYQEHENIFQSSKLTHFRLQTVISIVLIFVRFCFSSLRIRRLKAQRHQPPIINDVIDFLLYLLHSSYTLRYSTLSLNRILRRIILALYYCISRTLLWDIHFQNTISFYQQRLNLFRRMRERLIRFRGVSFLYTIIANVIFRIPILVHVILTSTTSVVVFQRIYDSESPKDSKTNLIQFSKILLVIIINTGILTYILNKDSYKFLDALLANTPQSPELPNVQIKQAEPYIKDTLNECQICLQKITVGNTEAKSVLRCQHSLNTVCFQCLIEYIRHSVQSAQYDIIACPISDCNEYFTCVQIRSILHSIGDFELLDQLDKNTTNQLLETLNDFIWCTNKGCTTGQLHDGGALNPIVTCHRCKHRTCFNHRIKWHEGLTCAEFDLQVTYENREDIKWIKMHAKKCPNCPFHIEKNDGCDHMTCLKCRHEFCWICLVPFDPIRRNGNHLHASTCKHYRPVTRA